MKTRTVFLWAMALFVIDQVVKIGIDRHFLDVRFDILPPLFYFKPTFNDQYSWINGLFQLGMGFWAHITLFCFIAALFVTYYDFIKAISSNARMVNIIFIFGFAGLMSGIIGTICWNGCLDYIYLKPWFVFDLKDLYVDCFVILFLLYYLKNRKHFSAFKTKDLVNHFKMRFATIKNLAKRSHEALANNQKSKMENGS